MKAAVRSVEYADTVNARKLNNCRDTKKPAFCGFFCILMLTADFLKQTFFHVSVLVITFEPQGLIVHLPLRDSGFICNLAHRILYR